MSFVLHKLLEDSAATSSDRVAVVDGDRSLTYRQLNEQANRLAHLLIELGVERGDRVGLFLEKSLEAVVALYGALKAGAAYVSIDVHAPVSRASYIVANCGIGVVISSSALADTWKELAEGTETLRHVVVQEEADKLHPAPERLAIHFADELKDRSTLDPQVGVIELDLAYIIYTSGSTGAPKGVKLTHLNALTFVNWGVEEFAVAAADRLSSHAPFHFDLSIFDLYAAAKVGATVYLVPPKISIFPIQVVRFIEEHEITVWYSVPSILSMMVQRGKLSSASAPSLRVLLFAGEVFPTKYLRRLMELVPHPVYANLYGPTETNVCTFYRVSEPPPLEAGAIPIGKAIANVDTFVVTESGDRASPGEIGELFVRGSSVMRGYWGDPERTAARLIPDPFASEVVDPVYRTGDLVREDANGDYLFLGRRDNQIKSRGYRIELGEIETAIYQHPEVAECAVVAVPDDLVTNRLVAYLAVRGTVTDKDLVRFCKELIPPYMVPEAFHLLEGLPKTSTGKIDRQSLLAREKEGS